LGCGGRRLPLCPHRREVRLIAGSHPPPSYALALVTTGPHPGPPPLRRGGRSCRTPGVGLRSSRPLFLDQHRNCRKQSVGLRISICVTLILWHRPLSGLAFSSRLGSTRSGDGSEGLPGRLGGSLALHIFPRARARKENNWFGARERERERERVGRLRSGGRTGVVGGGGIGAVLAKWVAGLCSLGRHDAGTALLAVPVLITRCLSWLFRSSPRCHGG
jgi:hypothetical protein